jgi:hypothetical protein
MLKLNESFYNKTYSVMLRQGWSNKYCDPFLVLGSAHFNGTLMIIQYGNLIFELENDKGLVIIPLENIKWMVPIKETKREEEYNWK